MLRLFIGLCAALALATLLGASPATGETVAVNGANGTPGAAGQPGGDGEDAVAEALGGSPDERATARGGTGGMAGSAPSGVVLPGGAGGRAEAVSSAAAAGATTATALSSANGGIGGRSLTGDAGGAGGSAVSHATAVSDAGDAFVTSAAAGGSGGANSGSGGDADARAVVQSGSGYAVAEGFARGGTGAPGGMQGGGGGDALFRVDAHAYGGSAYVQGRTFGGDGARGSQEGAAGGDAHTEIEAFARGDVLVSAQAFGGSGGTGDALPGAAGRASGTVLAVSDGGGDVMATLDVVGGQGGVSTSGSGADGADVSLHNEVTGSTTGSLAIRQTARGGRSGSSAAGAPPSKGGDASSILSRMGGVERSTSLHAFAQAGTRGDAFAEAVAHNAVGGNVVARATAEGGDSGGRATLGRVFGSSPDGGTVQVVGVVRADGDIDLQNAVDGVTPGVLQLIQQAWRPFDGGPGDVRSTLTHRGSHERLEVGSLADGAYSDSRVVAFNETGDVRAATESHAVHIANAHVEATALRDGASILVGDETSRSFSFLPAPVEAVAQDGRATSASIGRHVGDGEVRVYDWVTGTLEASSRATAENTGVSPVLASALALTGYGSGGTASAEADARGYGAVLAIADSHGRSSLLGTGQPETAISNASALGSSGSAIARAGSFGLSMHSEASVVSLARTAARVDQGDFGVLDAADAFATGVVNATPETLDALFAGSPDAQESFQHADRILGAARFSTHNSQQDDVTLRNAIVIDAFLDASRRTEFLIGLVGLDAVGEFDELRIQFQGPGAEDRPVLAELSFSSAEEARAGLQDATLQVVASFFECQLADCGIVPNLALEVVIFGAELGSTTQLELVLATTASEPAGLLVVGVGVALLGARRRRRRATASVLSGVLLAAVVCALPHASRATSTRSELGLVCPTPQTPVVVVDAYAPVELTAINDMSFATALSAATPAAATATAVPSTAPATLAPLLEGEATTSRFAGSATEPCQSTSLGVVEQDYAILGPAGAPPRATRLELELDGLVAARLASEARMALEVDLIDSTTGSLLAEVATLLVEPSGVTALDGLDLAAVSVTTSEVDVPDARSASTRIRGVATALLDVAPTERIGLRARLRMLGELADGTPSAFLVENAAARLLTRLRWSGLEPGGEVVPITVTSRDGDGDLVPDALDNCVDVPNPNQADIDPGDDDLSLPGIQHYGDVCDFDLDNDGVVGASDFFGVFLPCLRGLLPFDACEAADFDLNDRIETRDFFSGMRPALGSTPGPGYTEP